MRPLDHTKGRADDRHNHVGKRRTAEVISLDEWRLRRQPQAIQRRRRIVLPPPHPPPRARRHIPVEVLLIMLVIIGAVAGAMFAWMSLGYPTWI
jgi:hypothetical protein